MVNAPPSNGSVVVHVLCPCERVVLRPCRLGLPMRDGIERNRRGLTAALFAGEARGPSPVNFWGSFFFLCALLGFFGVWGSFSFLCFLFTENLLARSGYLIPLIEP